MKRKMPKFGGKAIAVATMLFLTSVALAACSKASTPVSQSQYNLVAVQQNKYLTARLYGLMTFDFAGTIVTFPTELTIASVPISWMGQVFNGQLEAVGPGKDITDQVHGSVSADGAWLLSLSYSRQIIRPGRDGVFYRITLKNVPIGKVANGTASEDRSFQKEGDIQKYIEEIEYIDGLLDGNKIVPTTTYISADWANSSEGQQPILKLKLEQVASEIIGELSAQSGMMG